MSSVQWKRGRKTCIVKAHNLCSQKYFIQALTNHIDINTEIKVQLLLILVDFYMRYNAYVIFNSYNTFFNFIIIFSARSKTTSKES